MNKDSLKRIVTSPKRFLVIGDIMLDKYCNGNINRISPEAPVPVLRYQGERNILGGAANVAANLVGMGQHVAIMSCVGDDVYGREMSAMLQEKNIDSSMVAVEASRKSTLKMRYVAGNQQLLRVDDETTDDLKPDTVKMLLEKLEQRINEFDIVLLSDYMKGVLSYDFTRQLIEIANAHNKKVIVDVKDPRSDKYAGAFLLKPNRKELHDLTGCKVDTREDVVDAMKQLKKNAGCQSVLATLSADGMAYLGEDDSVIFEKSDSRKVYDVVGAGDTAFAYLAAAYAFGFSNQDALRISNTASSIKVTKFGTSVVEINEVISELYGQTDKLQTMDTIEDVLEMQHGKTIVFTNGCFDILHIGHIRYLKEAKARGDILVLGLNSDASVKRLKGNDRPINNQTDRMEMLAEMEFIDYIVIFDDDTPIELIKKVKPDLLVKGGDYKIDNIVGADFVMSYGGRVEVIPFVEGKSTTNIINNMRKLQQLNDNENSAAWQER